MEWGIKEVKGGFFDTQAVKSAISAGERKVLSRYGAFVRRRMRSSIRRRKKVSEPGQPPSAHSGELKELIFFAFDPVTHSVVIGPVRFKRGEAPRLLEKGGDVTRQRKTGAKRLHYRPRPYAEPAGRAELPAFRESLKGMVR